MAYLNERNLEVGALANNGLLNAPNLVEYHGAVSSIDCIDGCCVSASARDSHQHFANRRK